ncbi:MAG TPA: efflux RND transporter periplasmic adaptor subunit [Rhodocyclaceae bacterium]|nr:efflux RND transporter periplasmic adaptor subunit [Rhodocyclaceae bacterium]
MSSFCRYSALLLTLFAATAQAGGDIALTPSQRQSLGVEVQAVQAASQGSAASLPATVAVPFEQMRVVAAPVAGLVEQVTVAAGDTVKAGQVLARLASPQLLELQRDHAVARSQSDLAARNLKRDEALYAEGIIAESRLSSTRASAKEAAAMELQRSGALQLAGGNGALVAPIGGVVLEQNAVPGQRVEASAPLFRIGKLSPLWLEIQVPASLAAELKPGLDVTVKDSQAKGKIINVGRQLGGSQTLTLRARIDKGAESLRPGQSVEAVVATQAATPSSSATKEALWRVPTGAVVRLPEPHVFAETAKGGFVALPVRVVSEGSGNTLVGGDLKEGYRIAVRGVAALKAALQ